MHGPSTVILLGHMMTVAERKSSSHAWMHFVCQYLGVGGKNLGGAIGAFFVSM